MGSWPMGIREQLRNVLRDVGISALLQVLRWLVERLADNPGPGSRDG